MKGPPEAYWSLFKVAHERVVPLLREGVHPGLLNPVFGLPEPKDLPKGRKPSPNERYWLDWFQEFSEIDASMKRLDQALVYLSHYPDARVFRFHKLSEADWIRYHVEGYLQETYILCERLRRFLRKVEKVAIAARDKAGLSSVKKQKAIVDASLSHVVRARGGHVHEYRFQDDELRDLDTLVLVTRNGKLRELRWVRRYKFDAALLKWRKQILRNNKETEKLCVALFKETTAAITRNEPTREPGPSSG
jgi:hypothetical protein